MIIRSRKAQIATIEGIIGSLILVSAISMAANFGAWNWGGSGIRTYNTVFDIAQAIAQNSTLRECIHLGKTQCVDGFLSMIISVERDGSASIQYRNMTYVEGNGICLYKRNFCYQFLGRGLCIAVCG